MSILQVADYQAGKIRTYTGLIVDLMRPTADMICVEDISMGLANVCRFGGQIGKHYSVALHSLLVMQLAQPELSRYAIIHDASEAYLGDVVKPLKHIIGEKYALIEDRWMHEICAKYGLCFSHLEAIKRYDGQALQMEHKYLQLGDRESKEAMYFGSFLERFKGKSTRTIAGIFEHNFENVFSKKEI